MIDRFGVVGGISNIAEYRMRNYIEEKKLREVLKMLGGGFRRALDFGCGYGRLTMILAEHSLKAIGIDVNKEMIEMAKRVYDDDFPNVEFRVYDGAKIPYDNDFFDLTLSFTVLQHIDKNRAQLMREIKRVTSKYIILVEREDIIEEFLRMKGDFKLAWLFPRYLGKTFSSKYHGYYAIFSKDLE